MQKLLIVYLILVFVHTVLLAQNKPPANPDPHRFDKEINAFIMYDQKTVFLKMLSSLLAVPAFVCGKHIWLFLNFL